MKSFKTMSLTVISEILKCLGGKLPNTVFSRIVSRGKKNYRTVRGIYPVHGLQDNLNKMSVFPKLIHIFNAILIKILASFYN